MIHSDFERGFIKAEVCAYEDFKTLGNGTKSMVSHCAALYCDHALNFRCSVEGASNIVCHLHRPISKQQANIAKKVEIT